MIEIIVDCGHIEKSFDDFQKKATCVLRNAINRTVINVRKNIAQETRSRYYIKSSDVKKTVKITKANNKSLCGVVKSTSGMIPLSKFKVTPKHAVTYNNGRPSPRFYRAGVKRAGGTKKLDKSPRAFITTTKDGRIGVFERLGKSDKTIRQLYGPSIPQMIENEVVISKIEKDAINTLQKRMDAEAKYFFGKG